MNKHLPSFQIQHLSKTTKAPHSLVKNRSLKFLISQTLDKDVADVVQQNAYTCISYLRPPTTPAVLVSIGAYLQKKAGRKIDERMARVAQVAGVFVYLRKSARIGFFQGVFKDMEKVGSRWTMHGQHGELLRSFKEYGGIAACPGGPVRVAILKWLVLTYVGTRGGRTSYGNVRHVFYSNSAAPLIREIIENPAAAIRDELIELKKDRDIMRALVTEHISRRFEDLIDLVETN